MAVTIWGARGRAPRHSAITCAITVPTLGPVCRVEEQDVRLHGCRHVDIGCDSSTRFNDQQYLTTILHADQLLRSLSSMLMIYVLVMNSYVAEYKSL